MKTSARAIDQRLLDLQLQKTEKEKKAREWHCLRGVMKHFQLKNPAIRSTFCDACRQRFTDQFEECQKRRRPENK